METHLMIYWRTFKVFCKIQRLLLENTSDLFKELIFTALSLFQKFCDSIWHAGYFWAKSWLMICSLRCFQFVIFCLSTCLLRIDYRFSMGLRSEEFPNHWSKISVHKFWNIVNTFDSWHGGHYNTFYIIIHASLYGQRCKWIHSLTWEATSKHG